MSISSEVHGGDSAVVQMGRLVPPVVKSFWQKALSPPVHRVVVNSALPLRAYVHPHSHLGRSLLKTGHYEPETEEIFRSELHKGNVFLDIGANEGFLTAFAATLVGSTGTVIAVEP